MALTHGAIAGGLVTTPDLESALADYQGRLGLKLRERGQVSASLAAAWGAPAVAGAAIATLQPSSGASCGIRLVEQPVPDGFRPVTTYGWAAYELTVQDVFGWPDRLVGSGFQVIGPPREIPGLPYFVAMQVLGRGREMLYLNEVRSDMADTDLPRAVSQVDRIFIAILATPDRAATMDWYVRHLRLEETSTFTIPYTMIQRAFGLPGDYLSTISMAQVGRMPILEVDDYPPAATTRPTQSGHLPPGNALVTLAVKSLDSIGLPFLAPPVRRGGPFYCGRRSATVRGPAGELLELVEIG